jgi:hypothetical protein
MCNGWDVINWDNVNWFVDGRGYITAGTKYDVKKLCRKHQKEFYVDGARNDWEQQQIRWCKHQLQCYRADTYGCSCPICVEDIQTFETQRRERAHRRLAIVEEELMKAVWNPKRFKTPEAIQWLLDS